jgi:hypothetical protein
VAPPQQKRVMGTLFLLLAAAFAGIAWAGAVSGGGAAHWVIAVAAGVIAAWFAGLSFRLLVRS